jgi:hypothetical protein
MSQQGAGGGGAATDAESADYAKQATGAAASTTTWIDPIPAKYNTNTELEREVKSGSNVIDLELTSS